MSNRITYNSNSKQHLKNKLSTVEHTLNVNINGLSNLYDTINSFGENPEMVQILTQIEVIKENKATARKNISELKQKMDINLEQISDLDSDASEMFKGW